MAESRTSGGDSGGTRSVSAVERSSDDVSADGPDAGLKKKGDSLGRYLIVERTG